MLIGRLVKQANNAMNQEMNAFAQQYGLTGTQMSIIDFLTHFPGNSCDQHQIENEFGIKRSTTTVRQRALEAYCCLRGLENEVTSDFCLAPSISFI